MKIEVLNRFENEFHTTETLP